MFHVGQHFIRTPSGRLSPACRPDAFDVQEIETGALPFDSHALSEPFVKPAIRIEGPDATAIDAKHMASARHIEQACDPMTRFPWH